MKSCFLSTAEWVQNGQLELFFHIFGKSVLFSQTKSAHSSQLKNDKKNQISNRPTGLFFLTTRWTGNDNLCTDGLKGLVGRLSALSVGVCGSLGVCGFVGSNLCLGITVKW